MGVNNADKQANEELLPLTFNFENSPNLSAVDFKNEFLHQNLADADEKAPRIDITEGKKGWEYIWVKSATGASRVVNGEVPTAARGVYVAHVYRESDFSALQLSGKML